MSLDLETLVQLVAFAVAFYAMFINFTKDPF
jgi:hypothetical protein